MIPQQQRRRRRRAALVRNTERRVILSRGPGGFGFTIAGQRPCVVSAVASNGPAERAGLRAGDALLSVDGVNIIRSPHASVARMIATAPGAISLIVAPRESAPTDTEDTEPDEKSKTRRRHPPPRRRPHAALAHHSGSHAVPGTSSVNEILQNLSYAQLTPNYVARLECRAIVGYLGTIETPQATSNAAPSNVRNTVRKLRQEKRPATPILLSVLPNKLFLRRPNGQVLAQYCRERIVFVGCGSEVDRRYFGLVTAADSSDNDTEVSHSCHVFAVDPRLADHDTHIDRAREFQVACTRDPVADRCLEFPPSSEYVVGVIKGMYSLPTDDYNSPVLKPLSNLAVKGDSPGIANFSRSSRAIIRPRERRCYHEEARVDGQDLVSNSPQPSNHSEITTTSSNSDSGIGFHNDGRNIADKILVVDFAGQQPVFNKVQQNIQRRPLGLVGCSFEYGFFLSNTTPVVDGFGGQGRPLNLDDVILNSNDMQPVNHVSPQKNEDNYNYNSIYGNAPSTSKNYSDGIGCVQKLTENEQNTYQITSSQSDTDIDRVVETFNSVEIYEEGAQKPIEYQSNESVENITVISGGTLKVGIDSISVYSSRSHEDTRPSRRKHVQTSLDDILVYGQKEEQNQLIQNDDVKFLHPGAMKLKVRKTKPLNILSKTKHMLSSKEKKLEARNRTLSASVGDVCDVGERDQMSTTTSEPDLRQSEQASPFRRWTTGNGTGSSYRQHDPRTMYNKQMSEGTNPTMNGIGEKDMRGRVARWSLGLETLLEDPAGYSAFAHFLEKEFAAENIRFWWACEQYRKCEDPMQRAVLAQSIWQQHLSEKAPEPVNVDAAARRATELNLHNNPAPIDLFLQAQKQIFNVMKFDSYPRFLRSAEHASCTRAELCDKPLPYKPHNHAEGPICHVNDSPAKLKKSASNVSERRRSGGGSLMPWRLRGVSRERNNQTPPPDLHQSQVTDVVNSQNALGQCSLCRVELPDSVRTVVNVDEGVTVRTLVDRLLHRRNLLCNSYDVILKDSVKGECKVIDANSPSSVLSGREAVVERRCVLRLEVGGRCVAVRCRPDRSMAYVVRAVLRRHPAGGASSTTGRAPRVVIDERGARLHPDTAVQDLDGKRLRVVELNDDERSGAVITDDEEGDSASELALRLQDDVRDADAQSGSSRSECSSSCGTGGVVNGVNGANRVRAALRAGPPLHYHPPDFLENLRETQHQMLQKKLEPVASPRTPPPPLPPKPAPRHPTLV